MSKLSYMDAYRLVIVEGFRPYFAGKQIRDFVDQANESDGSDSAITALGLYGAKRHWGCDPVNGKYDAVRLVRGYIQEEVRQIVADSEQAVREREWMYGDD